MAYTPSLNDIPETGGYAPSLADITEMDNKPSNPSLPFRITGDIAAGLANAGQGVHNLLSRALTPVMGKYAPAQTNIDFGGVFGVNNPNLGDKVLQNVAQYAPAIPLAGEKLLAQGLGGAAYNATQTDNPLTGALTGFVGGITGGIAGKAIPATINAGKNYLSQFAAQGLAKNIAKDLHPVTNITNQHAFNLAKQNFDQFNNQEAQAWDKLSALAKQADESGAKFDNQDYVGALSNKLSDLQGQASRQSGYNRANADAKTLLQDYINDKHGTFTDAIEHNKALNQDYQNEITPGKSLPFNIVNYAKQNVKQAIDNNIEGNELTDVLGDAWNDANNITAQKNKIFNEIINPSGKQQISKFSNFLKGGNKEYQDPTGFVNDYIPTTRGDGTQKMQQFAKMLGDEDTAKSVIKMNYFDKALKNENINAPTFLNKYNNLSKEQQNYLFTPEQNRTITALGKILDSSPNALDKNSEAFLTKAILGGSAGFGLGHSIGEPGLGFTAGLAAMPLTKIALSKLFEKPAISNYFTQYLTKAPVPTTGLAGNTIRAFVAPQITQVLNGLNSTGIAGMPAYNNN